MKFFLKMIAILFLVIFYALALAAICIGIYIEIYGLIYGDKYGERWMFIAGPVGMAFVIGFAWAIEYLDAH